MAQNTERLLDGYEVKHENQPKQQGFGHGKIPEVEGESYTISDKPNRLVCSLFDSLEKFEENHPGNIGKLYMVIATILFTIVFAVKQEVLSALPAIEVIFVTFLVTFVFNYYLMNGALFKPFLDNSRNSFSIKLCGSYAVGTIACFFYSLNFIALQTAVTIFYCSFFLAILIDMAFFKESYKFNELLFALGSLVGAVLTITFSAADVWSPAAPPVEGSSLTGYALSVISAIFMALIMNNFGKMSTENFTSMAHIFTLMIVLFTPMFFPIQGVVTPDMKQWGILVACGIAVAFGVLFLIRSFQLENSSRAAVFLALQVPLVFFVELVMNRVSGGLGFLGALITCACVFKYHQESESKNLARKSIVHQEGGQELHEISRKNSSK